MRKQIIYKENEPAKFIYIVQQGEFEVSRIRDTEITENLDINSGVYHGNHISFKQKKKKNIIMRIGIIGPGQVFGDEDVLNGRCYSTTVKCIS